MKTMKRCLQLSLKLVNATIAIVGIAMIFYGVWMIRVWQKDASDHHHHASSSSSLPWLYIYIYSVHENIGNISPLFLFDWIMFFFFCSFAGLFMFFLVLVLLCVESHVLVILLLILLIFIVFLLYPSFLIFFTLPDIMGWN